MFYHQDILSRKSGGLGVIWLAATLGSRSHLKKVSKKDIQNVKIRKICDYLASPPEPMALRLSSTLMVGVTRVYDQQCGFYMSEVNHAFIKLKKEVFFISGDIDLVTTMAKRDAITIPDDPILLNGALGMPVSPAFMDEYLPSPKRPRIQASPTPPRAISANVANISLPDNSPSMGGLYSSSSQMEEMPIFGDGQDLNLFGDIELDWEIADNGEIQTRQLPAQKRKRRYVETGLEAGDEVVEGDIYLAEVDDEQADITLALETGLNVPDVEQKAPKQSRRARLKVDIETELSNKELKDHRRLYVQRMMDLTDAKEQRESERQLSKTVDDLMKIHMPGHGQADLMTSALLDIWRLAGDSRLGYSQASVGAQQLYDDPQDVEDTYGPLRGPIQPSEIRMDVEVEQPRAASVSNLGSISSMMPWNQLASDLDIGNGKENTEIRALTEAQLSSPSSRPRSISFSFENMRPSSRQSSRPNSIVAPSPIGGLWSDGFERPAEEILEGLEPECVNFLQYARAQTLEEALGGSGVISFAELIPTDDGSRLMAAQAFHHVLGEM